MWRFVHSRFFLTIYPTCLIIIIDICALLGSYAAQFDSFFWGGDNLSFPFARVKQSFLDCLIFEDVISSTPWRKPELTNNNYQLYVTIFISVTVNIISCHSFLKYFPGIEAEYIPVITLCLKYVTHVYKKVQQQTTALVFIYRALQHVRPLL